MKYFKKVPKESLLDTTILLVSDRAFMLMQFIFFSFRVIIYYNFLSVLIFGVNFFIFFLA